MIRNCIAALVLWFPFLLSGSAAQPVGGVSLDRWDTVGSDAAHPVASGLKFDLTFGADKLPMLVYADSVSSTLNVMKWDGHVWTNLLRREVMGALPLEVRTARNWAGDVIVGLLSTVGIDVFQLRDSQLKPLGQTHSVQDANTFAVAIDAGGPIVAWSRAGFVVVKRWDGVNWTQLGSTVNETVNTFHEPQSPALAVTGDGKLVVAYTQLVGEGIGITVKVWAGSGWTALAAGVPPPSASLSLGGENSGAPMMAFLSGSGPQVSRWNGSAWTPPSRPCVAPPLVGGFFGSPSLTVRGSQSLVVCGINTNTVTVFGKRTLVARALSPLSGWEPLGTGTINGEIALAENRNLAYVIRAEPGGQPWVAWTAEGGANPGIIVSTLVRLTSGQ